MKDNMAPPVDEEEVSKDTVIPTNTQAAVSPAHQPSLDMPSKTIYIGGIVPKYCSSTVVLEKLLSKYGTVQRVRLIKRQPPPPQNKPQQHHHHHHHPYTCYAFADFDMAEHAAKAASALHGRTLGGVKLTVQLAGPSKQTRQQQTQQRQHHRVNIDLDSKINAIQAKLAENQK